MRGKWYVRRMKCACGLTAVSVAKKANFFNLIKDNSHFIPSVCSVNVLKPEYVVGFIAGFDGKPLRHIKDEIYKNGYKDGKAAWEAVDHHFDKTINLGGIWV